MNADQKDRRAMSETAPHPTLPNWVPGFAPRPPWWGGHLQTVAQKFNYPDDLTERFEPRDVLLDLGDGDSLAATLYQPQCSHTNGSNRRSPVISLLHGLGGTSQSSYIQSSADYLLRQGHQVLLVDFRGAGESASHTDRLHHPGRSEDIQKLIGALDDQDP